MTSDDTSKVTSAAMVTIRGRRVRPADVERFEAAPRRSAFVQADADDLASVVEASRRHEDERRANDRREGWRIIGVRTFGR